MPEEKNRQLAVGQRRDSLTIEAEQQGEYVTVDKIRHACTFFLRFCRGLWILNIKIDVRYCKQVFGEYVRQHIFKQCRIVFLLKLVLPDIAWRFFDLCFWILYFCLWRPWTWSQEAASLNTRNDVKVYFFLALGFLTEIHDTGSFFLMAWVSPSVV
jgi:hypothetical protein